MDDYRGGIYWVAQAYKEALEVQEQENARLRTENAELRARVINGQAVDVDRS